MNYPYSLYHASESVFKNRSPKIRAISSPPPVSLICANPFSRSCVRAEITSIEMGSLEEDLLDRGETSATILTLHARLLMRSGDLHTAAQQFRKAISQDPSLQDSELVDRLGVKQTQGFEIDAPSPEGIEKSTICFEDVGGMEEVKEEIRLKIIYPLTHADMYRAYGKSIGGGILLYNTPDRFMESKSHTGEGNHS